MSRAAVGSDDKGEQPAAPKRRGRPRGTRREVMLREAARLFYERGYHATGIDEIGAAAGVKGPTVYRHFASKLDLLVALIEGSADRSEADIIKVHEAGGTPDEMLERLVRSQIRQAVEDGPLVAVAAQEMRNLPQDVQLPLLRRDRINREEWAHLIAQVRPDMASAEVSAMVAGIKALLFAVVTPRTGLSAENLETLALNMVLGALRTH